MLDYLVSSKARRRLLALLWGEQASGSATELAERARVAFASVHRELRALKLRGLVSSVRLDGVEVFRASDSPESDLMRALVKAKGAAEPDADERATVRGELRTLGAPLLDPPVSVSDPEAALVRGAALAHRDPLVARVLPLCFRADQLDPDRLLRYARDAGEKQSVGFFLDLTAELSGDQRLSRWAERFRDNRWSRPRSFFPESSPLARETAERNTPPVARRWGLRMNMSREVFESVYEKHAHP